MFSRLTTRALLTVNQSVRCCGTSPIKVYGHYVSQPARAVLWLLKINDQVTILEINNHYYSLKLEISLHSLN